MCALLLSRCARFLKRRTKRKREHKILAGRTGGVSSWEKGRACNTRDVKHISYTTPLFTFSGTERRFRKDHIFPGINSSIRRSVNARAREMPSVRFIVLPSPFRPSAAAVAISFRFILGIELKTRGGKSKASDALAPSLPRERASEAGGRRIARRKFFLLVTSLVWFALPPSVIPQFFRGVVVGPVGR